MSSFRPESNPDEGGHVTCYGPHISLSWDKRGIRAKRTNFLVLVMRERRGEKEDSQGFLPRSTEFHWSVFIVPIKKVPRIDKGYA